MTDQQIINTCLYNKYGFEGGLNTDDIKIILSNEGLSIDGRRRLLRKRLCEKVLLFKIIKSSGFDDIFDDDIDSVDDVVAKKPVKKGKIKKITESDSDNDDIRDRMPKEVIKIPTHIFGTAQIKIYKSDLYNKRIILLSDIHELADITRCPNSKSIVNVIDDTLMQSSKPFIDLYMEIDYKKIGDIRDGYGEGYFDVIEKAYESCFSYFKRCPHKNLRAHYVDVRSENVIFIKLLSLFYIASQSETYIKRYRDGLVDYLKYYRRNMEKIKRILQNKSTIIEYIDSFKDKVKITKQLRKIKDHNIKIALETYYNQWLNGITNRDSKINYNIMIYEYMDKYVNLIESNYKTNPKLLTDVSQKIYDIYYAFAISQSVLMDIYTLGRIFSEFDPVKSKRLKHPTTQHNIIIIAGGYHIYQYEDFLNHLHFDNVYEAIADPIELQCINVSTLKYPLFSDDWY